MSGLILQGWNSFFVKLASNFFRFDKKDGKFSEWVENSVGKGGIARLQKTCTTDMWKQGLDWERAIITAKISTHINTGWSSLKLFAIVWFSVIYERLIVTHMFVRQNGFCGPVDIGWIAWYNAWTVYHTVPTFNDPGKEAFWKHCQKRRKCW